MSWEVPKAEPPEEPDLEVIDQNSGWIMIRTKSGIELSIAPDGEDVAIRSNVAILVGPRAHNAIAIRPADAKELKRRSLAGKKKR